jgi:hypothetical protein
MANIRVLLYARLGLFLTTIFVMVRQNTLTYKQLFRIPNTTVGKTDFGPIGTWDSFLSFVPVCKMFLKAPSLPHTEMLYRKIST